MQVDNYHGTDSKQRPSPSHVNSATNTLRYPDKTLLHTRNKHEMRVSEDKMQHKTCRYIYYCTREKKIDNARGEKLVLPFAPLVGWCVDILPLFSLVFPHETHEQSPHTNENHDITC